MSGIRTAFSVGMRRGAIEFRNSLQSPADLVYYVIANAILVVVIIANRDNMIDEIGLSVSRLIFPGVLAIAFVFTTTYGLATLISTEREDGTLLRAKSIPNGMTGYVVGQTTRTSLELTFGVTFAVIAGSLFIPGLWDNGFSAVAGTLGLLVLGLLATLPLGFALGSIFKNPRSLGGWGFLVLAGLVVVSGLFVPLAGQPVWMQIIGQIFPIYWLGLGMRSTILPAETAVIEIGESWRTLETLGVLGVWAVIGLLLAPVLLRRMARKESGSAIEARRAKFLQRVS